MLRKVRIAAGAVFFAAITVLFLGLGGRFNFFVGWMPKIQFVPALFALNLGVVVFLIILTLVIGRIYCSVICPMGVFQDIVSWIHSRKKHNRFSYSPAKSWLRYAVLVIFVIAFILGIGSLVALLEPYSAYGRIAQNIFSPISLGISNLLAMADDDMGGYNIASSDIWIRSIPTFIIAVITFIVIIILAWRNGRTYCNTICPVGTVLGFFSRFAIFRPVINTDKCNGCKKCVRNCKASCIDGDAHKIDYSRCVSCFDCIGNCKQGAIKFVAGRHNKVEMKKETNEADVPDTSRRNFISLLSMISVAATVKAQERKLDGGLAAIQDKEMPQRKTPLTPPGSLSAANFAKHCTACQLCVSECPNQVLRPSGNILTLMQPEMQYEKGYCRPECNHCSHVCPTGAIRPIRREEKSSIQIGNAVWIKKNCIVTTDQVSCGNCARHCPAGAITMVALNPGDPMSLQIPNIDTERCIGCGACEYLCPARPFSAIYVEGHEKHRMI